MGYILHSSHSCTQRINRSGVSCNTRNAPWASRCTMRFAVDLSILRRSHCVSSCVHLMIRSALFRVASSAFFLRSICRSLLSSFIFFSTSGSLSSFPTSRILPGSGPSSFALSASNTVVNVSPSAAKFARSWRLNANMSFFITAYTSSGQFRGWSKTSPLRTDFCVSSFFIVGYGVPPYAKISHMVTPVAHTSLCSLQRTTHHGQNINTQQVPVRFTATTQSVQTFCAQEPLPCNPHTHTLACTCVCNACCTAHHHRQGPNNAKHITAIGSDPGPKLAFLEALRSEPLDGELDILLQHPDVILSVLPLVWSRQPKVCYFNNHTVAQQTISRRQVHVNIFLLGNVLHSRDYSLAHEE
eukprot:m.501640 g.501640  ORF g.501640 m.501640 type:complete len:356 (-) comp21840_c0_seq3:490-1557(-)